MTAQQDTNLVRPNVSGNPPSREVLQFVQLVGLALIIGGLYIVGSAFYHDHFGDGYLCRYDCDSGYTWWQWVIPLIIGAVLTYLTIDKRYYWYGEVAQGKVVAKDFFVTGSLFFTASEHKLKLYGYNRAGELTYRWRSVTAGYYENKVIGDYADLS